MQSGLSSDDGIVQSRAQIYGVLAKKHTQSGSSSKWARRFFVVRDGYLLYYPESERREYGKHNFINIHPKGAIPLGFCEIHNVTEQFHPFALQITSAELMIPLVIAADTEFERDKWLDVLQQSCRITWNNSQLGDIMIRQLENHGLQMAKEKQDYIVKLQVEAMALHEEKLRADELEQLNAELAKERRKLERLASELTEEYEHIKHEFVETQTAMKMVEETKQDLLKTTHELESKLQSLENDRKQTLTRLIDRQANSHGPTVLDATTPVVNDVPPVSPSRSLEHDLQVIDEQAHTLLADKAVIEKRLTMYLEREHQLEEEKRVISEHASQLKQTLEDVKAQKAVTEAELKEEVLARLAAERRLQEAERRLNRLEKGIEQHGQNGKDMEETKEEMMTDVKAIKTFFESLAAEAKLDSDKSVMVKNAVHARKVIVRRAQTLKYETLKKQRKTKTFSRELDLETFVRMQNSQHD